MAWYLGILMYFWELFKEWLYAIFAVPFTNPEALWILAPIWLSWFFSEFFQEKKGTSMGNATSNATVVLWGAVDWTRQTMTLLTTAVIAGFWDVAFRVILIAAIFIYGTFITVLGIKGNKVIKKIGRVREVTYFIVIFTPILYGLMPLTFGFVLGALIFFPLFYWIIEIIDRITPNPKPIEEDVEESSGSMTQSPSLNFGQEKESGQQKEKPEDFGKNIKI
jgi:hypothetical protein